MIPVYNDNNQIEIGPFVFELKEQTSITIKDFTFRGGHIIEWGKIILRENTDPMFVTCCIFKKYYYSICG
jgi:hypothetical protein